MVEKYPSIPHWHKSPSVHRDDSYHADPDFFVGKRVVITEKIDGGNTLLHDGQVYARSVTSPASDGWFGMVKKHHAYKTLDSEFTPYSFYGEDIYGIHSIKYNPVKEDETYLLFAVKNATIFMSWEQVEYFAKRLEVRTVPVVHKGIFKSVDEITNFFESTIDKGSKLGPISEGFVMRTDGAIQDKEFTMKVCKYVRRNHVQTDQHWKRNWQPANLQKEHVS